MLKVILMLVLGSGTSDVLQLDRDEVNRGALSRDVTSRDDVQMLRTHLLLVDVGELRTVSGELGRRLVGTGPHDFQERLADLFDDDEFAAFLGGVMRITLDVLDEPDLVRAIEATLEPPKSPGPGTVGARFMQDCEPLEEAFGTDTALAWLASHRAQIESAPLFRMDAAMMGRHLLDEVYNPAATPRMAAIARSLVRFFARMLVVRYAMVASEQLPDAYVEGLFEQSPQDVDNVGSLLVSLMGGESQAPSRFSPIDLELESVNQGRNHLYIRWAIQRPPESADPIEDPDAT